MILCFFVDVTLSKVGGKLFCMTNWKDPNDHQKTKRIDTVAFTSLCRG